MTQPIIKAGSEGNPKVTICADLILYSEDRTVIEVTAGVALAVYGTSIKRAPTSLWGFVKLWWRMRSQRRRVT